MININDSCRDSNYIEIKANFDEDRVSMFLKQNEKYKTTKEFIRYSYDDMFYEFATEVRVYRKTSIYKELTANESIEYFTNYKIPYYLFPSVPFEKLGVERVKKISVRITHQIYLNIETSKINNRVSQKIFINYNHDSKQDLDIINTNISRLIPKLLGPTF